MRAASVAQHQGKKAFRGFASGRWRCKAAQSQQGDLCAGHKIAQFTTRRCAMVSISRSGRKPNARRDEANLTASFAIARLNRWCAAYPPRRPLAMRPAVRRTVDKPGAAVPMERRRPVFTRSATCFASEIDRPSWLTGHSRRDADNPSWHHSSSAACSDWHRARADSMMAGSGPNAT